MTWQCCPRAKSRRAALTWRRFSKNVEPCARSAIVSGAELGTREQPEVGGRPGRWWEKWGDVRDAGDWRAGNPSQGRSEPFRGPLENVRRGFSSGMEGFYGVDLQGRATLLGLGPPGRERDPKALLCRTRALSLSTKPDPCVAPGAMFRTRWLFSRFPKIKHTGCERPRSTPSRT